MKIAYFDCHSGISGDMILGALVDGGVPLKHIETQLKKLGLNDYRIRSRKVKRGLFGATQVLVESTSPTKGSRRRHLPHRTFPDIKNIIEGSKLDPAIQKDSIAVFEKLARAEARVHRSSIHKVHFHEVGAIDSIVDIVGGVVAMDYLKVDEIQSSPLNTGEGTVTCDHGVLPVPAPATLELLKGVPCYSNGIKTELTTPTGAALITHFTRNFGSLPSMNIEGTGYGAGSKIIKEIPNLLRVIFGTGDNPADQTITIIETNIDDMNPEFFDHVMELLFQEGAVDVYFTSIVMKKSRPAVKLTVLAPEEKREALSRIILTETSSFGLRWWNAGRMTLQREILKVPTPYGKVPVKIGMLEGKTVQCSPEYENCREIAAKRKLSLTKVYETIRQCALKKLEG